VFYRNTVLENKEMRGIIFSFKNDYSLTDLNFNSIVFNNYLIFTSKSHTNRHWRKSRTYFLISETGGEE
jgi:hypothetical protein